VGDSYNIINFSARFYSKTKNSIYEFTLKERAKVKMKNIWGLKRKVDIFIQTKIIFNSTYNKIT